MVQWRWWCEPVASRAVWAPKFDQFLVCVLSCACSQLGITQPRLRDELFVQVLKQVGWGPPTPILVSLLFPSRSLSLPTRHSTHTPTHTHTHYPTTALNPFFPPPPLTPYP